MTQRQSSARLRKGESTKNTILDHAFGMAAAIGLEGLSIGRLAEELCLSKSGLFAHFRSKEALQIQVLQTASDRFTADVIKPALKMGRGEPRLTTLFETWLAWGQGLAARRRGCVFFAAATELDDQPGAVRDELFKIQRSFADLIAGVVRQAQADKLLAADRISPEQFAQELYGIALAFHFYHRLFRDAFAEPRAREAFEKLMTRLRPARRAKGS